MSNAQINVLEVAVGVNPPAGTLTIYAKTDDTLHVLNSAGTDTQLGSGGGASALTGLSDCNVNDANLNEALGSGAGTSITSGVSNTIIGIQAAPAISAASLNVIVGDSTCPSLDGAGGNTLVGSTVGGVMTTASNATIIGAVAGATLATGANNTIIGNSADVAAGTDSDCTVIGANAVGHGSDTVTIGGPSVNIVYLGGNGTASIRGNGEQIQFGEAVVNTNVVPTTIDGTKFLQITYGGTQYNVALAVPGS